MKKTGLLAALAAVITLSACGTAQDAASVSTTPVATPSTTSTGESSSTPTSSSSFTKVDGLSLDLPSWPESKLVDSSLDADGTFYRDYETPAGLGLSVGRQLPLAMGSKEPVDAIADLFQQAAGTEDVPEVRADAAAAASLSYPAYRVAFSSGSGSTARTMELLYVTTDDWALLFGVSAASDKLPSGFDASVESVLGSVKLVDGPTFP